MPKHQRWFWVEKGLAEPNITGQTFWHLHWGKAPRSAVNKRALVVGAKPGMFQHGEDAPPEKASKKEHELGVTVTTKRLGVAEDVRLLTTDLMMHEEWMLGLGHAAACNSTVLGGIMDFSDF